MTDVLDLLHALEKIDKISGASDNFYRRRVRMFVSQQREFIEQAKREELEQAQQQQGGS